jgi:hypothetical protein
MLTDFSKEENKVDGSSPRSTLQYMGWVKKETIAIQEKVLGPDAK